MTTDDFFPLPPGHQLQKTPGLDKAVVVTNRLHWAVKNWVRNSIDDASIDPPEIDPADMTGACAIVSWMAQRILAKLGIESTLVRGDFDECTHCWLQIGRVVIDGTATQFGCPETVYVTTTKADTRYEGYLKDDQVEEELQVEWPGQSPYRFQPDLLKIERKVFVEMNRRSA